MTAALKVRRSLHEIQDEYKSGKNKKPLEDLMRAWRGIKALPAGNRHSFFMLGGYHGEPFRGAGWGSSVYWGGYCNHGNVLFPTWHRIYLLKLEEALQSIPGCEDVMQPFWDETNEESLKYGVPWALTDEFFELDGEQIPNPLCSFTFPKNITDHINGDNPDYSKPAGYKTVRYPYSGLVGKNDIEKTKVHNSRWTYEQSVDVLNNNVLEWLNSSIIVNDVVIPTNVAQKYIDCLDAPNYTVFSNTSSAAEWNGDRLKIDPDTGLPVPGQTYKAVVPLESPHNSIHLAIGGCEVPGYNRSPIPGANGDMGENDTAGLDPIFFFHHCNVDRVFWLWQKKHKATDHFSIIERYPGTNSVDSQGPTAGVSPNTWLNLESPLDPFMNEKTGKMYTSADCFNIETQLGHTYGPGSLDDKIAASFTAEKATENGRLIKASGINRAANSGSFLISLTGIIDNKEYLLGHEAVLSRRNVKYCANCQTHLEVEAFFNIPDFAQNLLGGDKSNWSLKAYVHRSNEASAAKSINAPDRSFLKNDIETLSMISPAEETIKLEIM